MIQLPSSKLRQAHSHNEVGGEKKAQRPTSSWRQGFRWTHLHFLTAYPETEMDKDSREHEGRRICSGFVALLAVCCFYPQWSPLVYCSSYFIYPHHSASPYPLSPPHRTGSILLFNCPQTAASQLHLKKKKKCVRAFCHIHDCITSKVCLTFRHIKRSLICEKNTFK